MRFILESGLSGSNACLNAGSMRRSVKGLVSPGLMKYSDKESGLFCSILNAFSRRFHIFDGFVGTSRDEFVTQSENALRRFDVSSLKLQ